MLPIALTLLAAVPTLPPDLAKCDVWDAVDQYAADYCDECMKLEPVDVAGKKAYRFQTADGGMGRNAEHDSVQWIVYPERCRMVGLMIVGGGGSPVMTASFVHGKKNTPPDTDEQELLKSWSGYAAFDPKEPADQLALADRSMSACGDSRGGRNVGTSGKTPKLTATAPVKVSWIHSKIVSQRASWRPVTIKPDELSGPNATCPCFSIFDGSLYRPAGDVVNAGGLRVQRFVTQARNSTDAYAISDPKRGTAWVGTLSGATSVLGTQHGRIWIRVPVFMDPGSSLIAIDPEQATFRWLYASADAAIDMSAVNEHGIELTDLYDPKKLSLDWKAVDLAFAGK